MINYEKLNRKLKKASNIFIMGHKNLDIDAIGASVGMKHYCDKIRKKSYIIIHDTKFEDSIGKALKYIKENININIGKFKDFEDKLNENSLLVIVDTYSEKRVQAPRSVGKFNNIIIVDHHLFGKPLTDNYFIDSKISSTCEIVTNLFKRKRLKINKHVATVLYDGIMVDSNNFTVKTTHKTLDTASYLLKNGANNKVIQDFHKTNIKSFTKIQKIIFKTEFYKKKYAFVLCEEDVIYEIPDLAKISDTLLMFDKIEEAFTIGYIKKNVIGVSARSHSTNISKIMKKLGGGGHKTHAASQIEITDDLKTLEDVKKVIKGELK